MRITAHRTNHLRVWTSPGFWSFLQQFPSAPGLIVHVDRLRILSLSARFVFFPYFVLTTLALRAEAVTLAQSTAV